MTKKRAAALAEQILLEGRDLPHLCQHAGGNYFLSVTLFSSGREVRVIGRDHWQRVKNAEAAENRRS